MKDNTLILCPICQEDFACCHMLRTWVIGSNVIACDGSSSFEDVTVLRLFPQLSAYRGSKVVILFSNELCNHFWFHVTEFHKGSCYETDIELTEEEIKKERLNHSPKEMWRD